MIGIFRGGAIAVLPAALVCVGLLGVPQLHAQENQVQSLVTKVDRLQRELLDLQRTVYQGAPAPASAPATTGGGDLPSTQAARIELRMAQFERAQQNLTGQAEELGFAVEELSAKFDRLEQRLLALESGGAQPLGSAGTSPLPQGQATAGGAPTSVGSISQSDLDSFQASQQKAAVSGGAALSGSDQEQYNQAFALLRQANYPAAEEALKGFISDNPSSPLLGNAKYWLGETYYVRGDYQQAAVTFAEAYQQHPEGSKAPDNLLKLGMSLASLGSVEDACGTFSELLSRYPNAAPSIVRRVQIERQKHSCP
jgi:tol-pal system protein YbgF